uniref:Uncharacterized protein n=1 Tax=Alexandrium catenella TaxID=2925 RepID=A0A7S1S395_ALECA|mmetsp:Transcript_84169/g.223493  ORF Transcript_84169/g.223493 Transcript_84169/m.223493 type:complete len:237 (+) Transcript_84169:60-770(+)
MALRFVLALALAAAARGVLIQDDAVSLLQRDAEVDADSTMTNTIMPPRPRMERLHLPAKEEVQRRLWETITGMAGESGRVFKKFIETDRRHERLMRETEVVDKAVVREREEARPAAEEEKRLSEESELNESRANHTREVVEEKKAKEEHKNARIERLKARVAFKEEERVQREHAEKEAKYEDRNALRAAKIAERDEKLEARKHAKSDARKRLAEQKQAQADFEADVMAGRIKMPGY